MLRLRAFWQRLAFRRCRRGVEEVVVVKPPIEFAGDLGSLGAVGRTAALQEDHSHNSTDLSVGIRSKPTKASARLGAGSGLAENLFFTEVEAQAAGRPVLYSAAHALDEFGNDRRDFQLALDLGLEVDDYLRRTRMLQIIEGAAVCNSRDQGTKLQRSQGDTLAVRAHLAHAAEPGINFPVRKDAQMLAFDIVTSELAQSELVSVQADFGKAQPPSDCLKICVVGLGQGLG